MWFSSPRRSLTPASARARRARLWLEGLEDRCLLSAGIALTPDQPAPQLVGQPITWTATAPDASAGAVYQFSVGSPGGPFHMVRDFSPDDSFTWAPMQEGKYRIRVAVKDGFNAQDTESAVVTDEVDSRVTGDQPVIRATSNPLVALFSAPPGPEGTVHVEFAVAGASPSWQSTNELPSDPGRSTNFFVAGMLPSTTYEMRDVFSDGTTSAPQLFTTGSIPSNLVFPHFTVQQPPGPGSDLDQGMIFHQFGSPGTTSNAPNPLATDLNGNVVWYYDVSQAGLTHTYAGQSLAPGGTVLLLGVDRYAPLPATLDVLREIDLAGNTLRETNIDAVNAQVTARGYHPVYTFTHDVERLPNGDTAVIAPTERTVNVNGKPTEYVGMTIVVLDKDFQVSWAWDAFDHLDVNRGPVLGEVLQPGGTDQLTASTPVFPAVDWLHINAVSWSPGDGNLIVSVRHQDWVLKIDYEDGKGDGHVIWRLGQGGDFTVNSTDPNPWFSHQHDAHLIDDNTLILFDNGNTRRAGDPTADSRGQVWKLDEQTMTATLLVNVDLGNYSMALGAAQRLSNGDYVFTSGFQGQAPNVFGQSIEVRPDGSKAYVLQVKGMEYRSFRIRTLYQGVSDQLTVTTTADSGPGSLRSEIALAQGGDTIDFAPTLAGQTITLTGGELAINKSLDIEGPGADKLTISGNHAGRVFDVSGSTTQVEISGLTVADGLADTTTTTGPLGNVALGGGLLNTGAHVTLSGVTFEDNQADGTQTGYVQTNLVSDIPGLAQVTDPNLKDPWGIAASAGGPFSVADQKGRVATTYSVTAAGVTALPAQTVAIPTTTFGKDQGPSGEVFNDTNSFLVNGTPATFIYAALNGTIDAWNSSLGTTARIEAATAGALYSGLDIESTASGDFLYAADPAQGRVDVFDGSFRPVNLGAGAFVDPQLPAGLAPFNVEGINGDVYVAYTLAGPAHYVPPEGVGAVAVFDTSGHFIKQLISGGKLASPWGIVLAPSTFGRFGGDLLVNNFSYVAPEINAFNPVTGAYLGTLTDGSGNTLLSNGQGLWDMSFGNGGNGGLPNTLYVATGLNAPAGVKAVPANDGSDGLFVAIDALPGIAEGGAVANVSDGTLTVTDSTFTDNQAVGSVRGAGGALAILSGTAAVRDTTITGNDARGADGANGGDGFGGGVYVGGGNVTIRDTAITHNNATGGTGSSTGMGGVGKGGGIANLGDVGTSTLTVRHSTLGDNQATGGVGGSSGNGFGGGIDNATDARLTVTDSTLSDNSAIGALHSVAGIPPLHAGAGIGGALSNDGGDAVALVSHSILSGNLAVGGDGVAGAAGGPARGGAIANNFMGAALTVTDSTLSDNRALGGDGGAGGPGGNGGNGGDATGGTIINASATLTVADCIFAGNQALGGAGGAGGAGGQGGAGGNGQGGAIDSLVFAATPTILPVLTVSASTFRDNEAVGGAGAAGGAGGNGLGGALAVFSGTVAIRDTKITGNEASGGEGGAGADGGNGQGGGLYVGGGTVTIQDSKITRNEAEGGPGGEGGSDGQGAGGGVYVVPGGTVTVNRTRIKHNHASTGSDNVFGDLGD